MMDQLPASQMQPSRPQTRVLFFIVLAAVGTRVVAAAMRGDFLGHNESLYIMLGRSLLSGGGYALNGLPNASFPFGVPLVAGFFDLLGGPRVALSLPSAILGGLAVVPLFFLARKMASHTVAVASGIFYAGLPALIDFSPYVPYSWRLYEGSEQIYIFFFLCAAWFAYKASLDGRLRDYLLSGLSAGAAYEVRQDAILVITALFIYLALSAAFVRSRTRVLRTLVFAAAALMVALPWLIYSTHLTGSPLRAPRIAAAFNTRDRVALAREANDEALATMPYCEVAPDGVSLESPFFALTSANAASADIAFGKMLSDMRPAYATETLRLFVSRALSPPFALAALGGLVALLVSPGRWRNLFFLGLLFAPAAVIVMLLYPCRQFWIYATPLVALLIGWGVSFAFELFFAAVSRYARFAFLATVAAATVVTAVAAYRTLAFQNSMYHDSRSAEHVLTTLNTEAAAWIAENSSTAASVMSADPSLALLSKRDWLVLPDAQSWALIDYAYENNAGFLVLLVRRDADRPPMLRDHLSLAVSGQARGYRFTLLVYSLAHVRPIPPTSGVLQ